MLDTIIYAATEGGNRALQLQEQLRIISPIEKSTYRGDFRTRADLESQEIIKRILHDKYPSIPIVAEEDQQHRIGSPTFFTVDPLDGTWIYAHGCSEWGSIVGYVKDKEIQATAMYLPAAKTLITAEKCRGCKINGEQIQLSAPDQLQKSIVGILFMSVTNRQVHEEIYTSLLYQSLAHRNLSSNIGGTVELLLGRCSAHIAYHGYIWDHVSALAVTEAGGAVSAFDGSSLQWNSVPMEVVFAANEHLLEEIVTITRKAQDKKRYKR